ncbi:hypothetical protein CRE_19884 [Caenorhabditis remanei]|uniref:Uncharacterized protein n=1 Tax=Caenorhabditis remanei TaxID=31234 RepID=E3N2Y5_CAERE|nr:hypothetical protein CRE_19884 [Caenorhabditis remanei]
MISVCPDVCIPSDNHKIQHYTTYNTTLSFNRILYADLKKDIQSFTNIPNDFQELRFRGEDLPVVERPIQDIKFGEEIVVKHSLLDSCLK